MINKLQQFMGAFINNGSQVQNITINEGQEKINELERERIMAINEKFKNLEIEESFKQLQELIINSKDAKEKEKYLFLKYLFLYEMNDEKSIEIFKVLKEENIPNYLLESYHNHNYFIHKDFGSKKKLSTEYNYDEKTFEILDFYNNQEYKECVDLIEDKETQVNIISKIFLIIQKIKFEVIDDEIEEIFALKEKIEKTDISKIEKIKIDYMYIILLLTLDSEKYGVEHYQKNIEKFITDVESFDTSKIKEYDFIKKIINIYLAANIHLYGLFDTEEKLKENKEILDKINILNLSLLEGEALDKIINEIFIERNPENLRIVSDILINCGKNKKALDILEEHYKTVETDDDLKFKIIMLKIGLKRKVKKQEEAFLIEKMETNLVYKYFYNKLKSIAIEEKFLEEITSNEKIPYFVIKDIVICGTENFLESNKVVLKYKKKYPQLILDLLKKYEIKNYATGQNFKILCDGLTEIEKDNNAEKIGEIFLLFGDDAIEETFEYFLRAWNKKHNESLFFKIINFLQKYKIYNEDIHNYFIKNILNKTKTKEDELFEKMLYSFGNYNEAIFSINKLLIEIINNSEDVETSFVKNLGYYFNLDIHNKAKLEDRNKTFTIEEEIFILNENNEVPTMGIKRVSAAKLLLLRKSNKIEECSLFNWLSHKIIFNPINIKKIPGVIVCNVEEELNNKDVEGFLKKLKKACGVDEREKECELYLQKHSKGIIDLISFDGYYLFDIVDKIIKNNQMLRRNDMIFNKFNEEKILISLESLVFAFQLGILESFNQDNIFIQKSVFENIIRNAVKGYTQYQLLLEDVIKIFEDGEKILDDYGILFFKEIEKESWVYTYTKAVYYMEKENYTYITDDYNKFEEKNSPKVVSILEYLFSKYSDFSLIRQQKDFIPLSNIQRDRIKALLKEYE